MAEGKKKIIVYADWQEDFEDLTDSEAGQLIKHFFRYVNDENPVLEDRVLNSIWKPMRRQLKRDLGKWEERAEKSRENGKKGGRPKKEPRKPSGLFRNPEKPTGFKKTC